MRRSEPGRGKCADTRWSTATWIVVLGVVALAFVANLVWIARDHQAPPWDQANYLHISFEWRHALTHDGPRAFVSAVYHTNPSYAPLYMLVITPFEAIANGVDAALVANTLMFCATIAVAATIATRLYGRLAAIPAAIFTATCPIIYGLSRTELVDFLLTFLSAVAVLTAVRSGGFQRRGWAILFGACVGLATLTKITAPGIVVLPALCCLALPERVDVKRQLTNLGLAMAVGILVALPWYAVNLGPAWDYLRSTTSGQLAVGTTGNPLTVHAFLAFASLTIDSGIGAILVLTLVVAATLAIRRLRHRRLRRRDVVRIAIPASWFLVGFVALAVNHNQDIRYLAPGITGLAVLAAGAIAVIRPRVMGAIVLAIAAGALVVQFLSFVADVPPAQGAHIQAGPVAFRLYIPFDGTPLDYTRRPGLPDYATPVIRTLAVAESRLSLGALDVCLLETHEVINGNTLGYVAESRGVPLTFTDLSYQPGISAAALAQELARCPTALYISGDTGHGRVGILNRASAAFRITQSELRGFDGPRTTLPVGDGLTVRVLERAH